MALPDQSIGQSAKTFYNSLGGINIAAAFSDSKAACKALEGMTRQPEMAGKLFTNMLVAIGLIESIPIIAIVIALVLVFANPFLK